MKSQVIKDWYWYFTGPICWLNLQGQKVRWRYLASQGDLLLNLGSGKEYVDGFINIEGMVGRKKDLWLNLTHGLPFKTGQVRAVYLSHVLEHFFFEQAVSLLQECRRVLKPQGGIRIVVPSLEKAVDAYSRGDVEWFSTFPDHFDSVGGRFSNHMLCRDQHRLLLDRSFVVEILEAARLTPAEPVRSSDSLIFSEEDLALLEPAEKQGFVEESLVVEAVKA